MQGEGQGRRRFYERWRWIEWLFAASIAYLLVMSLIKPETDDTAAGLAVVAFIAYKAIAYFIDLSERQCSACGARARNDEDRCNNCGDFLARN
ncbi:MAG TPA: hypothetical protein VHF90_04075 [Thermoleophilaceae bacterium]|nr:hypothetical protein [Thermoleophilaceae bacterium]